MLKIHSDCCVFMCVSVGNDVFFLYPVKLVLAISRENRIISVSVFNMLCAQQQQYRVVMRHVTFLFANKVNKVSMIYQ